MQFLIGILTLVMLFIIHYDNKNTQSQQQWVYPILGFNGICIREDIIHELYAKCSKYWDIWYFTHAQMSQSGNFVTYYFRVFEPKFDYDNKRFTRIVKQLSEQILVQWFQNHGANGIPIDAFVAVVLCGTELNISMAVNDAGFAEIAELRKLSH